MIARDGIRVAAAATMVAIGARAVATETIAYTYDAQGRIVTVASTGTVNNNQTTTYTHDNADNRERVVVTGAPS